MAKPVMASAAQPSVALSIALSDRALPPACFVAARPATTAAASRA